MRLSREATDGIQAPSRVLWDYAPELAAAVIAINAACMLMLPRAWFRLPTWILAKGTLTEKKCAQDGELIEVRLTGAIMRVLIAYVVV